MAQYPTAVATLPSLSNQTYFNTTLVNTWVTEMMALQRDYASTIAGFSTLASYFNVIRDANGKFKIGQVTHGAVVSALASQHHTKLHANSHMTSDAIRPSQDGKAYYPGLLTKNQFNKIDSCASNPNTGYQAGGSYVGAGSTAYTTNAIGFRPKYMSVYDANGACWQYYWMDTWTYEILEAQAYMDIGYWRTTNMVCNNRI